MGRGPHNRIDDDDYPAYTTGRAAEMLGTTQSFLRSLDEANLITPHRSEGGHRLYSRHQLRLAARARELADQGTPPDAARRIIHLEDQLREALRSDHSRSLGHNAAPAQRAAPTGGQRLSASGRRETA